MGVRLLHVKWGIIFFLLIYLFICFINFFLFVENLNIHLYILGVPYAIGVGSKR